MPALFLLTQCSRLCLTRSAHSVFIFLCNQQNFYCIIFKLTKKQFCKWQSKCGSFSVTCRYKHRYIIFIYIHTYTILNWIELNAACHSKKLRKLKIWKFKRILHQLMHFQCLPTNIHTYIYTYIQKYVMFCVTFSAVSLMSDNICTKMLGVYMLI